MLSLPLISHSVYLTGSTAVLRARRRSSLGGKWEHVGTSALVDLEMLLSMSEVKFGRLRVWVGSGLCRLLSFPRPPGLYLDEQICVVARRFFADRFELNDKEWYVDVHVQKNGVAASAIRRATLQFIISICDEKKIKLHGVSPWIGCAMAAHGRMRSRGRIFGVIEDDAVTVIDWRKTPFQLTSLSVFTKNDAQTLDRIIIQQKLPNTFPILEMKTSLLTENDRKKKEDFSDLFNVAE